MPSGNIATRLKKSKKARNSPDQEWNTEDFRTRPKLELRAKHGTSNIHISMTIHLSTDLIKALAITIIAEA